MKQGIGNATEARIQNSTVRRESKTSSILRKTLRSRVCRVEENMPKNADKSERHSALLEEPAYYRSIIKYSVVTLQYLFSVCSPLLPSHALLHKPLKLLRMGVIIFILKTIFRLHLKLKIKYSGSESTSLSSKSNLLGVTLMVGTFSNTFFLDHLCVSLTCI